jgi:hypothetical protein
MIPIFFICDSYYSFSRSGSHLFRRRKKEEGRRKKEEGRRKKEEGINHKDS